MPFRDIGKDPFSEAEMQELEQMSRRLNEILATKTIQLSPKERQRYGAINEKNKLLVLKVQDYRKNAPELSSPQVDWEAFEKQYASFRFLEKLIDRIEGGFTDLFSTKVMRGYLALQWARIDYAYTRFLFKSSVSGAEAKYRDLSQLYHRKKNTDDGDETQGDNENNVGEE